MPPFSRDVRTAARSLRKSPGFAATAILTLALGIGANVVIFSVVEGILLAPLPFRDPDRLAMVLLYNQNLKYATYTSYPDFADWQRNATSFEQIAAFSTQGYDLTNPGAPQHLAGARVSSNFFATLGAKFEIGRDFSPEEDRPGGAPAVMISNQLWRDRFHRDPSAVGRIMTLSGVDFTIAGVLARDFRFLDQPADVYVPIARGDPAQLASRVVHNIGCVARLKPNVTIAQAKAQMDSVQSRIGDQFPESERGQSGYVAPLKQFLAGDVGGTLLLLFGAVALVLLIACANVANLLLARSAARAREFSVRVALGATRGDIVRQLLTESLLLSLAGGALALGLAKFGLDAVLALMPGSVPGIADVGIDPPVLAFTLGISIAVGILFGLAPGFKSARRDLVALINDGARGSAGGQQTRQRILAALQIATALILLTGASLLIRTIQNLWQVNPGFSTRDLITFKVGLSPSVTQTAETTRVAFRQLTDRIRHIPGVEAADLTALLPLSQSDNSGGFWIGPHATGSVAQAPRALYYWTGPDYLRVMRIPLLQGRYVDEHDTAGSEPVIVIDSVLARSYFADQNPIGKTITVANWKSAKIVGVVGHVNHWKLGSSDPFARSEIYGSFYQLDDRWVPAFRDGLRIAVRTRPDAAAIMPTIRNAVYGGDEPVYDIHSMQDLISGSMAPQRFPMLLLTAFAALALLLACVGIYGVLSYAMTQRVREFGIRLALGAVRRDVVRLVIAQGLKLALVGVAIGAAAALALTRLLGSFSRLLYGIHASDPFTLIGAALILICVALLASYIPARRASRLDPIVALRQD